MPLSSQSVKALLAAALVAGAGVWMWQTWSSYHPDPGQRSSAVERDRAPAERSEELTPEERRQRQHRALYRRLEMTQEQRREANALEARLTEQGDYREADFRRGLRAILTTEQIDALDVWLQERREARQARQADGA